MFSSSPFSLPKSVTLSRAIGIPSRLFNRQQGGLPEMNGKASQTAQHKIKAQLMLVSVGGWAKKGIHFRNSNCIKKLILANSLGLIVYSDASSPVTDNPSERRTSTTRLYWLTAGPQTAQEPS